MPQYNFLCRVCKKEFSKIMTISEYEKSEIVCEWCVDSQ
jgi:DNA-directed RNA polymerase subunit RPC12/RpoP